MGPNQNRKEGGIVEPFHERRRRNKVWHHDQCQSNRSDPIGRSGCEERLVGFLCSRLGHDGYMTVRSLYSVMSFLDGMELKFRVSGPMLDGQYLIRYTESIVMLIPYEVPHRKHIYQNRRLEKVKKLLHFFMIFKHTYV